MTLDHQEGPSRSAGRRRQQPLEPVLRLRQELKEKFKSLDAGHESQEIEESCRAAIDFVSKKEKAVCLCLRALPFADDCRIVFEAWVADEFVQITAHILRNIEQQQQQRQLQDATFREPIEPKKRRSKRENFSIEVTEVLKSWLHNNFDDPYPSAEVKIQLADRTKLTYEQVQHWFVNARMRIWRPKVDHKHYRGSAPAPVVPAVPPTPSVVAENSSRSSRKGKPRSSKRRAIAVDSAASPVSSASSLAVVVPPLPLQPVVPSIAPQFPDSLLQALKGFDVPHTPYSPGSSMGLELEVS